MSTGVSFVPALGFDWLTPFYDAVAWLVGEQALKTHVVERARIDGPLDVLDLGCGTGTLAILVKRLRPAARVTGLDVDAKILAIARRKITQAGLEVALCEGSATDPPLPEHAFDRVLTTLVLHHLDTSAKRQALAAARRLLRPGGELHVADFGRPHTWLMAAVARLVGHLDGHGGTAANLAGELPVLVAEAGFTDVAEDERWASPFGTIAFIRARIPA
jgi:ubiquinone/menaquinone biosynthesis C-methylase UbiE